jgi:hypothetical protein
MNNLQFIVICGLAIFALFGGAALLGEAHAPQKKSCIEAGHEWSSTKYVCVAKQRNK